MGPAVVYSYDMMYDDRSVPATSWNAMRKGSFSTRKRFFSFVISARKCTSGLECLRKGSFSTRKRCFSFVISARKCTSGLQSDCSRLQSGPSPQKSWTGLTIFAQSVQTAGLDYVEHCPDRPLPQGQTKENRLGPMLVVRDRKTTNQRPPLQRVREVED